MQIESISRDPLFYASHWGLDLQPGFLHTPRATLAFGHRGREAVVLKVMQDGSDEHQGAAALVHYAGDGAVRCLEQLGHAVLLERVEPGFTLSRQVLAGDDDQAMRSLCGVIRRLHAHSGIPGGPEGFPTVERWGAGLASARHGALHPLLPAALVERAEKMYEALCYSQGPRRLLHGDLHHDNVLYSAARGWVAIDPKGVIGEPEYELGAALRNPGLDTALYADRAIIARRIAIAADELGFERMRLAGWCFSQAVLSSVWAAADGESERAIARGIAVADATWPLL
ncbi:aminoglycoside phosphotransferase family protein [Paraburkholderia hayleyella]|uniref:aminoglycoside phosphotransferase family protein n=1 Tax=Paraburkholderia hayleyella TaxID=2152889 RepID=UPI0012923C79|nr:aminoglycoside phosphotransferase family protein [Paraburkholderia hayleyella]